MKQRFVPVATIRRLQAPSPSVKVPSGNIPCGVSNQAAGALLTDWSSAVLCCAGPHRRAAHEGLRAAAAGSARFGAVYTLVQDACKAAWQQALKALGLAHKQPICVPSLLIGG